MNLTQMVDRLRSTPEFMKNVTCWKEIPPRDAVYADFPDDIDPRMRKALRERGINKLYSHQRKALDAVRGQKHVVVVTPTASGKTLCYNLPVLLDILENPDGRALYLFPTKALSMDQSADLYETVSALDVDIKAFTYDGDTPATARRAIRQAGHIVVTNPDMLHSGILPHHTKWVKLFENLRFVVIDEIHTYRGLFGGNLANVLRRLKRLCAFYGSNPQFICCSATIKNPIELTRYITGYDPVLIDENGAPSGMRHIVMFNPPVVNAQLGIRSGSLKEARRIASLLVKNGIQTIVFARSRLIVEVLVRYLKQLVQDTLGRSYLVRGYRGGYLPTLRREIEKGLRSGEVRAVVSTNALELGIDIGRLDACVLCGYPGTIASTWQQGGRAGRRQEASLMILVASSSPLDQYIINNPQYFFDQSPENALVNPDNFFVVMNHLKCAAYELPFVDGEPFIDGDEESTRMMLSHLVERDIVRHVGDRYHWSNEEFPSAEISLRSAAEENFAIVDITVPKHKVIGEMDRFTVPMLLHEKAIYLHEGEQYQVEKLDFPERKAYVRHVDVDYYTDADLATSLRILDVFEEEQVPLPTGEPGVTRMYGEVVATAMVTMFKKIKFDTHENIGFGHVDLPETQMHTTAYWAVFPDGLCASYGRDELQGALLGISNVLQKLAPLYLMCAYQDLHVAFHVKDPFNGRPTIYLYEAIVGGMGLSEKLYELHELLLMQAFSHIQSCPCPGGCPSCVGPFAEVSPTGKRVALDILRRLV